ncbi:MBOAT family O-acyltransferase [Zobellia nedashkovskayae]|uniref:MBOAT family O-acyltransferase n=1 Tax=Zobellia nedashkovskayae TaxID=2779510 RepID=UPI00188B66AA|nr:MBOAT family protein [Zobellia nedashkovskayae]
MLFNSIDFAVFLPIVFILYWFIFCKSIKAQNFLIVVASYFFYGWWDWKFLSLIAFSTLIDYSIGVGLSKENRPSKRKILLWISIIVNLGFLGFFKYYNFFLDNFISAFSFFGYSINGSSLNIILPVGISFYTFQTLSYTIDVYRKQLKPTKDFIAFSAFVCFFPQLVAGPIERATHLLPQFYKKRKFKYSLAVDGMRQILWGLFKKIVIADNCAEYANQIFNNSNEFSGSSLLLGAIFFTFQIYCDFSGYSDIAIGTSRLFGFDLMKNFAFPYFSRDIAEFWRSWHISLSTWFRDYLYIPLGGSRGGTWMKIRNTFIIFLVSGFWHGANWTFIIWGGLNALYFLPLLLSGKNRQNLGVTAEGKILPSIKEIFQIGSTFILTVLAWVFFRAENISHALNYLKGIFDMSFFSKPQIFPTTILSLLTIFIFIEWLQREKNHGLEIYGNGLLKNRYIRWIAYICIIIVIFSFGGSQQEFIYFQF